MKHVINLRSRVTAQIQREKKYLTTFKTSMKLLFLGLRFFFFCEMKLHYVLINRNLHVLHSSFLYSLFRTTWEERRITEKTKSSFKTWSNFQIFDNSLKLQRQPGYYNHHPHHLCIFRKRKEIKNSFKTYKALMMMIMIPWFLPPYNHQASLKSNKTQDASSVVTGKKKQRKTQISIR